jgi:hypothetical protein
MTVANWRPDEKLLEKPLRFATQAVDLREN